MRKCENQMCVLTAKYGYVVPNYCSVHRKVGMTHKLKNICYRKYCYRKSEFQLDNKKTCSIHKIPGSRKKNKNKKCLKCDKYPSFGFMHGKPRYCFSHKEFMMINLVKKRCLKCDKTASFGYYVRLFCFRHATADMKNLK